MMNDNTNFTRLMSENENVDMTDTIMNLKTRKMYTGHRWQEVQDNHAVADRFPEVTTYRLK